MAIVGKIIAGILIAFLTLFILYEGYQLIYKIIKVSKDKKSNKILVDNDDNFKDHNN